jgi:hypothetical protein
VVERRFSELGGFWGVVRLYDCYWRENGTLARQRVKPLRGAIMATIISSVFILAVGVLVWLWGIIHDPGKEAICYTFVVALSVSTCVVIPDQFVKYSNLPGRVLGGFPEDIPLTPMWWGFLIGTYASVVVLRNQGLDFLQDVLNILRQFPESKDIGIFGFPILWLMIIFALTKHFLSAGARAGWRTWGIFWCSWVIGVIACEILAFLMVGAL